MLANVMGQALFQKGLNVSSACGFCLSRHEIFVSSCTLESRSGSCVLVSELVLGVKNQILFVLG